jgi:SAM-dependent methyltransferase
MSHASDKTFAGALPEAYERFLVPLIFEPYATDLAARLARHPPRQVLEIAAGTGAVTRALASALPDDTAIIATDLNQPMLDQAAARGTDRPVIWQKADAMALPFPDEAFDAVLCQFGAMFFADKSRAFAETRRVLKPGGTFYVSVWDRIDANEFAATVTDAVASLFPGDPPRFLARIPHGYHDTEAIRRDVVAAGFTKPPSIATVAARSRATACDHPAIGYCHGTPLRNEIDARSPGRLAEATAAATDAIARQFGRGPIDGRIQAHVVSVSR